MASFSEGSVPVGSSFADYVSFGSGSTPLVIIPGLSLAGIKGTGAAVSRMYRAFSGDFHVFCIDRKHDISPGCTIESLSDDYALAIDALGISEAPIFGLSQGGMIAQYLAIEHPALVKSLALAVTLSRLNPVAESCLSRWAALAGLEDYPALFSDIFSSAYSPAYVARFEHLFPLLATIRRPDSPSRFVSLVNSCLSCSCYERLSEIRCPVFVIGGKEDRVVSPEGSYEIAEKLNCPIYMYDSLGHAAYEEAPDFNFRVASFFLHPDC